MKILWVGEWGRAVWDFGVVLAVGWEQRVVWVPVLEPE
jgi:hypothetical protein